MSVTLSNSALKQLTQRFPTNAYVKLEVDLTDKKTHVCVRHIIVHKQDSCLKYEVFKTPSTSVQRENELKFNLGYLDHTSNIENIDFFKVEVCKYIQMKMNLPKQTEGEVSGKTSALALFDKSISRGEYITLEIKTFDEQGHGKLYHMLLVKHEYHLFYERFHSSAELLSRVHHLIHEEHYSAYTGTLIDTAALMDEIRPMIQTKMSIGRLL